MIKIENCPVCNSTDLETQIQTMDYFLTKEKFTIDRCKSCGFLLTNPRPEDKDLDDYYQSEEYLSHDNSISGLKDLLYDAVKRFSVRQKYSLVEKYSGLPGGKVLDYGCGTGSLLNQFKTHSWIVNGIEPNEKAARYARSRYGIKIYQDIHDLEPEEKYDVIMLWHVIEHLPNLNESIQQIRKHLKKEGSLFVAFPNIESPDALKYGKYWAALDVPRHLYHFSRDTFSRLIEKHGFTIKEILPMKFDAFYVSLLSEQYLQSGLLSYPKAFMEGWKSNRKAKKPNNYSSLIFVLK